MKKIVFFDADGTLWYPKSTKRKKNPIWIHIEIKDIGKIRKNLILVPGVKETLKKLKRKGVKLAVLSASPLSQKKAQKKLEGTLEKFGILNFFDEVHATKPYFESKGEHMTKIIKKYKIKKSEALMVGDIYLWDFVSAKKAGIKAILFKHMYDPMPHHYKKIRSIVSNFNEVMDYV